VCWYVLDSSQEARANTFKLDFRGKDLEAPQVNSETDQTKELFSKDLEEELR
jgi:hypothetical protein